VGTMLIRNVPDDVLRRLKERAAKAGKSAEQMAREAIAREAGMTREEAWAAMDAIRARSKPVDLETALRIMQEGRDERDARPYLPDLDDDH
jgi:plasmid stability protein